MLSSREIDALPTAVFMHGTATYHIVYPVKAFLILAVTRPISSNCNIKWPLRLPDLIQLDFWLKSHLEVRNYLIITY